MDDKADIQKPSPKLGATGGLPHPQDDLFNIDESLNLPTHEVLHLNNSQHPNKYSSLDGTSKRDLLYKKQLVVGNDGAIQERQQEGEAQPHGNKLMEFEVENVKERNHLKSFTKPFRNMSNNHVSKSFYVFIGFSVLSTILILPFQIFLLFDSTHLDSFNGYLGYLVFTTKALTVCCSLLIFARVYQIFMSITALITKNTIQALYVLVYLISVFVSSVNYMRQFPVSLTYETTHGDFIMVRFSSYWIICISGLTIVAQVVLFVWKLGKELSWQSFKSMKSSMSTRSMVLVVQNYKALLILNGFFIICDLVISINFSYKATHGSYDALSIIAMILIGLTPLVFCYLYFAVDRKSVVALKFGMFYMLSLFIFTVMSSYMAPSFSAMYRYYPDVFDGYTESFVDKSVEYYLYIDPFRGAFVPFHYLFLAFSFVVSIYLISLFYRERNPKCAGLWKKPKNAELPSDANCAGEQNELESQIAVLLQQNIILVTVASILGIGFMSYIYTVRRKYLLSWYLVSIISIFAILGLSIAVYLYFVATVTDSCPNYLKIFNRTDKSTSLQTSILIKITKIKYLFVASIIASFILLNGAVYFTFFIVNLCQYYSFYENIYINSVPECLYYIYYQGSLITAEHARPYNSTSYEQAKQQLDTYATEVYDPALEALLPMGKGKPSALAILMCFVAFTLLFRQSLNYSKLLYLTHKYISLPQQKFLNVTANEKPSQSPSKEITAVEPVVTTTSSADPVEEPVKLSAVSKLCLGLVSLVYFNMYFISMVFLIYAAFPLDYWLIYEIEGVSVSLPDFNPTLIAIGVIHIAYIVIVIGATYMITYLRHKNLKSSEKSRTATKILALWFMGSGVIWIPMICYQFYKMLWIFNIVEGSHDNVTIFFPVLAGLMVQLVSFLVVIIGGGFLWWKVRQEGQKYEVV